MAYQADSVRNGKGTELTQVQLSSLSQASKTFNFDNSAKYKPIVALGPANNCFPFCCFNCCIQVPSGYHLIFQKWNAAYTVGTDDETGAPIPFKKEGLICCWPYWKRVSHIVTQKAVRFNAPVMNVSVDRTKGTVGL